MGRRGKADEDAHRPRRIGLRPSQTRDGRQHGSARCELQEFATEKFHCSLSIVITQRADERSLFDER